MECPAIRLVAVGIGDWKLHFAVQRAFQENGSHRSRYAGALPRRASALRGLAAFGLFRQVAIPDGGLRRARFAPAGHKGE